MKIIFFGSDDFAAQNLEKLIQVGHEVVACVTQPDRAKGRGLKIEASSIKVTAQQKGIPVLQPTDIKSRTLQDQLKAYKSDLFVVIAYGRILPSAVLEIPRLCAINVHCSLLPKYRGAAPVNWAIINGEKETGISIIKINETLDAGDIFAQAKVTIEEDDTAVTLKAKIAELGAECLCQTIDALESNTQDLKRQDDAKATHASKLTKKMGVISWKKSAKEIHDLARGLLPWPTAYTYYKNKLLKILETDVISKDSSAYQPGELIEILDNGFLVAAGTSCLLIREVHLESSKRMDAKSFSIGHEISPGYKFE